LTSIQISAELFWLWFYSPSRRW